MSFSRHHSLTDLSLLRLSWTLLDQSYRFWSVLKDCKLFSMIQNTPIHFDHNILEYFRIG